MPQPPPPRPLNLADAFSVRGQVALVTGAAGRIGSTIAEAFAANGSAVVMSDVSGERLENGANRLRETHGAEIAAQPADLRSPDELKALIAAVESRFGRLTAIVHAGAIITSRPIKDEADDDFDRLFHTNLRSAWLLAKYALPMLEASQGSMTSIASVNGHRAMFACSLYSGTKSALITMTAELAAELGPQRVRFNTVSPGSIQGEGGYLSRVAERLHSPHREKLVELFGPESETLATSVQPLPTRGDPWDIAMACVYLASPAARFVTGADLLVDGGMLHMLDQQHRRGDKGGGNTFWRRIRDFLLPLPDEAWKEKRPEWVNPNW